MNEENNNPIGSQNWNGSPPRKRVRTSEEAEQEMETSTSHLPLSEASSSASSAAETNVHHLLQVPNDHDEPPPRRLRMARRSAESSPILLNSVARSPSSLTMALGRRSTPVEPSFLPVSHLWVDDGERPALSRENSSSTNAEGAADGANGTHGFVSMASDMDTGVASSASVAASVTTDDNNNTDDEELHAFTMAVHDFSALERALGNAPFVGASGDQVMGEEDVDATCHPPMDEDIKAMNGQQPGPTVWYPSDSSAGNERHQALELTNGGNVNGNCSNGVTMNCGLGAQPSPNYEEIHRILFDYAKDQKFPLLMRSLRIILQSHAAKSLMQRIVKDEDDTGMTLLMCSVRNNFFSLCSFLLQHGADVNYYSQKRTYALLLAAQKGLAKMARFLVDHGANNDSKDMALIPAAHFGHLEVVKILLEYGANQNYANIKGTTPLMRAAQEGREEVVQYLLERGALPCTSNNEGMTALMLAAQRGHAEIAQCLIRAGSDVNKQTRQGSTALLLAAKRGHTQAVEALLTAGADIFLKDDRDKTAGEIAHRRGHVELFLKITVTNQLRLMREDLRRERSYLLLKMSTLYLSSRAHFTPSFQLPERRWYTDLMDATLRLPRPLLQNICLFLPLCHLWDRQLRYLAYEASSHPNRVVLQGVNIMDEVLLNASMDIREANNPSSPKAKQDEESGYPTGHLQLLREDAEFQELFVKKSRLPLSHQMLIQLRRFADIQGVLSWYTTNQAVQFNEHVAQDVVSVLTQLLEWDDARKRMEFYDPVRFEQVSSSPPKQELEPCQWMDEELNEWRPTSSC